jgi:hypothetical protein
MAQLNAENSPQTENMAQCRKIDAVFCSAKETYLAADNTLLFTILRKPRLDACTPQKIMATCHVVIIVPLSDTSAPKVGNLRKELSHIIS